MRKPETLPEAEAGGDSPDSPSLAPPYGDESSRIAEAMPACVFSAPWGFGNKILSFNHLPGRLAMDKPEDPLPFVDAPERIQALRESAKKCLDALDTGMLFWNLLLAGAVLLAGVDRVLLFWTGFFGNLPWLFLRRRYLGLISAMQAFSQAEGLEPGGKAGGVRPAR